jgi:hypothetical protein
MQGADAVGDSMSKVDDVFGGSHGVRDKIDESMAFQ